MANILNATNVKLYYGAGQTPIANCTSAQVTINSEMMGATTKDSGGWEESLPGKKSWTMSGDFLYEQVPGGSAVALSTLFDALVAKTKFLVYFSTKTQGQHQYSGNCYIESIDMSAGVEDNVTFNISLKGTGAITRSSYSGIGT